MYDLVLATTTKTTKITHVRESSRFIRQFFGLRRKSGRHLNCSVKRMRKRTATYLCVYYVNVCMCVFDLNKLINCNKLGKWLIGSYLFWFLIWFFFVLCFSAIEYYNWPMWILNEWHKQNCSIDMNDLIDGQYDTMNVQLIESPAMLSVFWMLMNEKWWNSVRWLMTMTINVGRCEWQVNRWMAAKANGNQINVVWLEQYVAYTNEMFAKNACDQRTKNCLMS